MLFQEFSKANMDPWIPENKKKKQKIQNEAIYQRF